jgi:hypothetical protein
MDLEPVKARVAHRPQRIPVGFDANGDLDALRKAARHGAVLGDRDMPRGLGVKDESQEVRAARVRKVGVDKRGQAADLDLDCVDHGAEG